MFFDNWFYGIIFGVVTTVALFAICYPLTAMWKKYEDPQPRAGQGCDPNHH